MSNRNATFYFILYLIPYRIYKYNFVAKCTDTKTKYQSIFSIEHIRKCVIHAIIVAETTQNKIVVYSGTEWRNG